MISEMGGAVKQCFTLVNHRLSSDAENLPKIAVDKIR